MRSIYLSLLFLFLLAGWARADGDIVYSARYYLPPGSHGTSHFHLYRINPDGTGKRQITFGRHDDDDPLWSPDGKLISFNRDRTQLCVLNVGSGHITMLVPKNYYRYDDPVRWCPDSRRLFVSSTGNVIDIQTKLFQHLASFSDFIWSPDGTHAMVQKGNSYSIYRQSKAASILLKGISRSPVWLDPQTLAALSVHSEDQYNLRLIGLNGIVQRQFAVQFPKTVPGLEDTPLGISADDLLPTPRRQHLVYAKDHENSYVGVDFQFFILNLKTEKMHYLTQGQFLSWSPDGKRFCTAPGRDVVDYQKRYDPDGFDDDRMVWVSPLYIRNADGGPMHQLTPRLSWVTAADWRRVGR